MGRFLPLAAAFLCGVLAEAVNYYITRAALDKKSGAAAIFPVRPLVAALFLASLYYVGKGRKLDVMPFMIAGVLGATAGLAVFTFLLMRKIKNNGKVGGSDG